MRNSQHKSTFEKWKHNILTGRDLELQKQQQNLRSGAKTDIEQNLSRYHWLTFRFRGIFNTYLLTRN